MRTTFFIPQTPCKETGFWEVITPSDEIIAYGDPDNYVCYNLEELPEFLSHDANSFDTEELVELKVLLNDKIADLRKHDIIRLINTYLDKRRHDLDMFLKMFNEATNTNKEIIRDALISTIKAADNPTIENYLSAIELIKIVPTDIRKFMYTIPRDYMNMTIETILSNVILGRLDLNYARTILTKTAGYYLSEIYKVEANKLKEELTNNYMALERGTPQVNTGVKIKSVLPKNLLLRSVYEAPYQEFCSVIGTGLPPLKLIALANILKIDYDIDISWVDLCGKVKKSLYMLL